MLGLFALLGLLGMLGLLGLLGLHGMRGLHALLALLVLLGLLALLGLLVLLGLLGLHALLGLHGRRGAMTPDLKDATSAAQAITEWSDMFAAYTEGDKDASNQYAFVLTQLFANHVAPWKAEVERLREALEGIENAPTTFDGGSIQWCRNKAGTALRSTKP